MSSLWHGFLILFITSFFLLTEVKTQEVDDTAAAGKNILLEDIVVTAERTPVQPFRSGRVIKVITNEEIRCMPAQSIDALLEHVLFLDVRQRGANGVQSDVSIRGGSFDQTMILLNGINISDPQTGHHNMNLPVDADDISRIEILGGPGARCFGANAFGGVINVITKREKANNAHLRVSAGDFGLLKAGLSTSVTKGPSRNFLSASFHSSEGYEKNTDYRITNLYYTNRIEIKPGRIDFQAGFTSRAFGANSFYSPRYPDQYENIRTFFTGIRLSNNNTKTNVSPYFYWRHNRDQFALFRKNPPEWYKNDNYHLTDVKGYGLDLSRSFLTGTLSGGLDYRHEKILSNVLGEILLQPVVIPWEDTLLFTRGHTRFHAGIFIDYSATIRKFYLSAGVMLAFNSGNRALLSLYPGLDLSYRLSERVRWFASVNRALRLPTFTDLYYYSPVQKGNPGLLPEKAVAIESGIKINYSNLKGNFSFFRRMGKEIIDWVKYPYDSIWISMNHTRVNVNGFELFVEWKPLKTADERFSLKSVKLGYGYLNPDKESGEMQSKYSLDVLSNRVDFGLEYSLIAKILMSLRLSYRCREGGYQPFENNRYLPEVKYPDTFVADGKISREFKSFNVYVEVTNILNTRYYDNANVPEPGRWIKAGINLRIF